MTGTSRNSQLELKLLVPCRALRYSLFTACTILHDCCCIEFNNQHWQLLYLFSFHVQVVFSSQINDVGSSFVELTEEVCDCDLLQCAEFPLLYSIVAFVRDRRNGVRVCQTLRNLLIVSNLIDHELCLLLHSVCAQNITKYGSSL